MAQNQEAAVFLRHFAQTLTYALTQFLPFRAVLRRGSFEIRNDVFELQIFFRLIGQRRFRNILLDGDSAGALRFQAIDFSVKPLDRKLDEPTFEFSADW